MSTASRSLGRTFWVAIKAMLIGTLLLGVAYPLLITGIGQLAFPTQANGSLLRDDTGTVVGSALLGQAASDAAGNPLPEYFQPRPSATPDGQNGGVSGGSNLGPENPELVAKITARRDAVAAFNGVAASAVPVDAVTASASGLDPHISPAYAAIQSDRVAAARGIPVAEVTRLVARATALPDLGYAGEARVNVTELNLALDAMSNTHSTEG